MPLVLAPSGPCVTITLELTVDLADEEFSKLGWLPCACCGWAANLHARWPF